MTFLATRVYADGDQITKLFGADERRRIVGDGSTESGSIQLELLVNVIPQPDGALLDCNSATRLLHEDLMNLDALADHVEGSEG